MKHKVTYVGMVDNGDDIDLDVSFVIDGKGRVYGKGGELTMGNAYSTSCGCCSESVAGPFDCFKVEVEQ